MNLFRPLPVPRYYRMAVSAFYFIQGIVFASWASRIPDVQDRLHLGDGALGGILFALPLGQLSAMMLSGHLVNRFGSKAMLTVGALLYPAGLLLLGIVQQRWQLFGALFLFGIVGNLSNISINTQGVGVERLYRRSIMASFHGLWSLAGFFGGLITTLMIAAGIAPFTHFVCINLLTLALLLSAGRYLIPRDAKPASAEESRKKKFLKPDRSIVLLGMIAFACMICEGTMFDWAGIYFERIVHAPQEFTRLGYIAFMSTMAGGRFVSDLFVTRYGTKKILQVSGILIFSGMLMAVLFPSMLMATAGFLLVGVGTSSVVPLVYSLAGRSGRLPAGIALAMVSSIGFLGFLLGPPLIGFVAEGFSLRMSFMLIAFMGIGTALLARKMGKLRRDQRQGL